MFDLSLRVWKVVLNINLGKEKPEEDEEPEPYTDVKMAAHLGSPAGFGLLLRPDHIDSE